MRSWLYFDEMNRRTSLFLIVGMLTSVQQSVACMWDTDTLKDELMSDPSMFDLITGQFPHHGDAYYKLRIERLSKVKELTIDQLNDKAVAHVRLKQFDQANTLLKLAHDRNPKHYPTLSNIGVTAKKQGDFAKGALYISKALKIKPEGHMGLGDWYLKALIWREKYENANEENLPVHSFIGSSYSKQFADKYYGTGKNPSSKIDLSKSKHAQLIRNDQSFADGFLLVGDYLKYRGHLHLSFLAHTRAMMLGHQNLEEVRRRRRTYLKYAKIFGSKPMTKQKVRAVNPWAHEIKRAEKLINDGAEWLQAFKDTEAELLQSVDDERKVTFKDVEKSLMKKGIEKVGAKERVANKH